METKTHTAKSRRDAQENGIPDPPLPFVPAKQRIMMFNL